MEGDDRVPLQNLSSGTVNTTGTYTTNAPPAGPPPQ